MENFWFLFALLTLLFWSFGDLFCKATSDSDDKVSHWRIVISVGIVMGLHALYLLSINGSMPADEAFKIADVITYLPVSFFYILSMIIGYVGLRYLAVSIVSPVSNTSGAFTFILLVVQAIFIGEAPFETVTDMVLQILGTLLITTGVVLLAFVEQENDVKARLKSGEKIDKKYTHGALALIFPILYCVFDTLGTTADGIVLDGEPAILSEHAALIAYELTFFAMAIYAMIHIKFIKKQKIFMGKQSWKMIFPGICETIGQIFYVYAMSGKAVAAAPIISSYCLFSMLWGRVILKEKLSKWQYLALLIASAGILLFGIAEGVAEM